MAVQAADRSANRRCPAAQGNHPYKTVLTLLGRLEAKSYEKRKLSGKAHVVFPAVKSVQVIKTTVGEFTDRLFGGDPRPLMQFLAEKGHIRVTLVRFNLSRSWFRLWRRVKGQSWGIKVMSEPIRLTRVFLNAI